MIDLKPCLKHASCLSVPVRVKVPCQYFLANSQHWTLIVKPYPLKIVSLCSDDVKLSFNRLTQGKQIKILKEDYCSKKR